MSPEQTPSRFAANPAYVRCQRLLKELQELMARGEGESERADAVRDAMEAIRHALDAAESLRIEELSADLYMLTGEEIFQDISPAERATLPQRLQRAFDEGRFEEVLALLRYEADFLPRELIAYLRGRCWFRLHDYEPAVWFSQYAHELTPGEPGPAVMVLDALWRAGRQADVMERARGIVENPSAHPTVLLTAALMLFRLAEQQEEAAARPLYERVVHAIERALEEEATLLPEERIPANTFAGRVGRALALEKLGRESEARQAHQDNLQEHPKDPLAWTIAGLFESQRDVQRAARYLQRAVELESRHVSPYLFLAHHRLDEGRFQEVIDLCRTGIELATRQEDLARFYEWSAIARHRLGDPDRTVRELFDAATRLDPLNLRIRQNREAFERFVAAQHAAPPPRLEASSVPNLSEAFRALIASVTVAQAA
jgi:tetratricopeptide (TPR) repeat protein